MREKKLKQGINLSKRTQKQRCVIEMAVEEPDLTQAELARQTGISPSTISRVHRDYLDIMLPPDAVGIQDIDSELYERIVAGIKRGQNVISVEQKYDLNLSQGGSKEVDVAVWAEGGGHEFLIDIECKFENHPIEQDVVAALNYYVENSTASKGVVIAKSGFQPGAKQIARQSDTELYTLRAIETGNPDLDDRIMAVRTEVTTRRNTPYLRYIDLSYPNGNHLTNFPEIICRDPRLFSLDGEPTGETIYSLGQEVVERGLGEHEVEVGDRLIEGDGELYLLDRVLIDVLEESSKVTRESSAFDEYDLYMKNNLEPEDQKLEFYTIEEALANLTETRDESEQGERVAS